MKKITVLCGVALFSLVSVNAQADIQSMNDEALSEVEGQLGLIDSTRFIAGAHVAGAYVAHEAVETGVRLAVVHEIAETGVRLAVAHDLAEIKVAHEVVEAGARIGFLAFVNSFTKPDAP